ncbi:undecaprenyl-diphosphate phosphatase [Cryobacterium sp. 5I3]|uniref:undecaprenyl-diphosphate phosphatase n=1 Tax=Cryobacterium sp. 5I3 TaxID=3048592 RepID=UPI002B23E9FF|nr:undecaprenyl-diphosphate phosphatase [Cryobacterium sp. 5I3]MEB0202745.1 undecaprenyl-diphosphate phosphatase [Cryobacterium sp. 5I3]
MITLIQAAILGFLQGITELFPISSLGHSVILPTLFGWNIDQSSAAFLGLLVATHLATAIVLFLFFIKDWIRVFRGFGRSIRDRKIGPDDIYAKLAWLLIAATIPAGIVGLLLEKPLRSLFASPLIAAAFLVINGLILLTAERLRRHPNRAQTGRVSVDAVSGGRPIPAGSANTQMSETERSDTTIAKLTWKQAFGIGVAQTAALLPGISRSGSTMVGGLLSGLNHETAARFSFLLATPIIGAAAALKLPGLFSPQMADESGAFLVGALCSAVAAWLATKFLLRFFETRTLTPFAIYCIVAGTIFFVVLLAFP